MSEIIVNVEYKPAISNGGGPGWAIIGSNHLGLEIRLEVAQDDVNIDDVVQRIAETLADFWIGGHR